MSNLLDEIVRAQNRGEVLGIAPICSAVTGHSNRVTALQPYAPESVWICEAGTVTSQRVVFW
jgi:hypothetical protein